MVTQDMVAVKDFLWDKNNAGELNIDKLCIIGAEIGASVALNSPPTMRPVTTRGRILRTVETGAVRQGAGADLAEVGLSGLALAPGHGNPVVQSDIPMMIFAGKQNPTAMQEAKQLYHAFEKFHPEPASDDAQTIREKRTLWLIPLDTKLQGTTLLDRNSAAPCASVPDHIAAFVYNRLVKSDESKDWAWKERKYPHG